MDSLQRLEIKSAEIVDLLKNAHKPCLVWDWHRHRCLPEGVDVLVFNEYLSGDSAVLDKYMRRLFRWCGLKTFKLYQLSFSYDKEALFCWPDERLINRFSALSDIDLFANELLRPLFPDVMHGFCNYGCFSLYLDYFKNINSNFIFVVPENMSY